MVRSRSLLVRTVGEPSAILPDVQRAVWSVDPTLPVYGVDTMDELVRRRLGGFAVIGYLMGIFALLSLLLGAVGIYGVTAYAAGQRTAELGLRIAMGADPSDVVRMMLFQGGRRALLGLVVGLILAGLLSGAMTRILVGVSPRDPLTFASVALVLAAVSLLGLYLPARRAARVDPVRALAAE
jgi:ABC-type antimicrobial peptide transport system permease subunit